MMHKRIFYSVERAYYLAHVLRNQNTHNLKESILSIAVILKPIIKNEKKSHVPMS